MDQTKPIGARVNGVSNETGMWVPAPAGAAAIAPLSDLELMLVGGGDGILVW